MACSPGCPDCGKSGFSGREPTVLDEAQRIVQGPRRAAYGTPQENHSRTAVLWSAYLHARGCPAAFSAEDVCALNLLQKIAREIHEPGRDNRVDMLGYVLNWDEIARAR